MSEASSRRASEVQAGVRRTDDLGADDPGATDQENSDLELVKAARAGNQSALEILLERHQPRIYRFGMKMCRDPEDAQDILQETLLAMARTVGNFRGTSSISTWLWTIARSFCIKKRRKSKFAPEREESLDADDGPREAAHLVVDPAPDPEQILEDRELRAAVDDAIDSLDPMYREVLVLRDVEGLTAREVSEVLGLGVEAVKSRLHRARVAVRTRVAPLLGAAPPAPAGESCPDILDLWSRNLEGEISPDLCAEMERHVATCGTCRASCDSLKRTLAICRTSATPEVPISVQDAVREAIRKLAAQNR
jgi:RNA polymerase sigma-70 factor (ECF subfamily)